MSIWLHRDSVSIAKWTDLCPHCKQDLQCRDVTGLANEAGVIAWGASKRGGEYETNVGEAVFSSCALCGWWITQLRGADNFNDPPGHPYQSVGALSSIGAGALKYLDLDDISTPLDEVRQYLCFKQKSRFSLSPELFEETVASVFRDHGYQATAIGRSGDGGVDVVLESAAEKQIGVQVKRYRNRIQVEQIRSFLGALILKGMTAGVFVTTSDFTSGADYISIRSGELGIPIRMMDGEGFLSALRMVQRTRYTEEDICGILTNEEFHDWDYSAPAVTLERIEPAQVIRDRNNLMKKLRQGLKSNNALQADEDSKHLTPVGEGHVRGTS